MRTRGVSSFGRGKSEKMLSDLRSGRLPNKIRRQALPHQTRPGWNKGKAAGQRIKGVLCLFYPRRHTSFLPSCHTMVSLSFLPYVSSLLPLTRPVPGNSPVELCDLSARHSLRLDSVDITPNPPERGANLTITASGLLHTAVADGAYVDVVVNYGYIKLLTQTYDLCEELPNVDMTCPVAEGAYTLTKEVAIPGEVPPGKYTVFARAYNKDDTMITCLTGSVEFSAAGAVAVL